MPERPYATNGHPRRTLLQHAAAMLALACVAWAPPSEGRQDTSGRPRFEEVSERAGVRVVHQHSPTPEKHIIESVPGGVAALDYDGDGRTDLFFTNGASSPGLEKPGPSHWNRLFRNDGNGRFSDVTEKAGAAGTGYAMGVAAADFDNDGDVDLFVAGVRRHQLLRNSGQGTFEDIANRAGIASGEWAVAGGWFDYDNDGALDLLVVNYLKWSPAFDRWCGDDARGIRVYCHPRYFEGLANRLYRNRQDGMFEDVTQKSGIGRHVGKGMSVAFLDADRDGRLDAFVTNDGVPNFLFRNAGDGTFEETGLISGVAVPSSGRPISSMGADAQDIDRDGHPDIVWSALAGETFPLFRGDGRGAFVDATHASGLAALTVKRSGWCALLLDLDQDGALDLFTANGHVNDRIEAFEATSWKQANSLFRNDGGRFVDVSAEAGFAGRVAAHRGCAAADLNADGLPDLVVSALGDPAEIWENRTTRAGHWLGVTLVGTKSNRDGIGARVTVGGLTRMMTTSAGYASSSHGPLLFGVGARARVARVEIVWPSGTRQVVEDVPADQVLTVKEPAGLEPR